jgi:hypothetical protein
MSEVAMVNAPRKKSPRAPSLSLDEALEKALKAYERERLHPAPTEVVAQNIGYKSANNGAALSALASLRYFGLLERPKEGLLAVTKEVEAFKFAPDERISHPLLIGFLRHPQLYAELLEKYDSGLPSDGNLKFELIQRGFGPQAAEVALASFKRSVEFSRYFQFAVGNPEEVAEDHSGLSGSVPPGSASAQARQVSIVDEPRSQQADVVPHLKRDETSGLDRIPVRLPGARRAWLLIPTPFFNTDKARLKAQIDLLLTEEEEQGASITAAE